MRPLRDAACAYAVRGWAVMPLRARAKQPLGNLVPHGINDATSDLLTVFEWWQRVPRANVGIHCGPSGLVVLDVDPRHGGDDSLFDQERRLGPLPLTPRSISGGGGEHYLFHHPGGILVGVMAEGLDIKDHGYIVAPPSIHPSGRTYEWDVAPGEAPLAELPERWVEAMRPRGGLGRRDAPQLNHDHGDALRRIPAAVYVPRLTGREVNGDGFVTCPFHKGGQERTPSLSVGDTLWACYGCDPILGKRVMGGNILDFAGLLWDFAIPLRGADFAEVDSRLRRFFL